MKRRFISWLPMILVMILIFVYSSKTATESEQSSNQVSHIVISIAEFFQPNMIENQEYIEVLEKVDKVIRKVAHGTEYFILALCCCYPLLKQGVERKKAALYGFLICLCYATSDEFHQLFVPGRSGQIKDILIDGLGAALGCTLVRCKVKNIHYR